MDTTVALFQIAKVNRLLVQANVPEDNLRGLLQLRARHKDVRWTIHTLDAEDKGVKGWISDISYLIDVNQHSAVVKGYIDNPGDRLRSGQFITATIDVPPPPDVVEVPVDAVVDDGRQCVVFVEDGRCNAWWWGGPEGAERLSRLNLPFTLRRVEVTHRYDKVLLGAQPALRPSRGLDASGRGARTAAPPGLASRRACADYRRVGVEERVGRPGIEINCFSGKGEAESVAVAPRLGRLRWPRRLGPPYGIPGAGTEQPIENTSWFARSSSGP